MLRYIKRKILTLVLNYIYRAVGYDEVCCTCCNDKSYTLDFFKNINYVVGTSNGSEDEKIFKVLIKEGEVYFITFEDSHYYTPDEVCILRVLEDGSLL